MTLPRLWKPFGSSARQDGVMFYHWIRSDVDKQLVDYPYAKFNKKLDIKENLYIFINIQKIRLESDFLYMLTESFGLKN